MVISLDEIRLVFAVSVLQDKRTVALKISASRESFLPRNTANKTEGNEIFQI